MLASPSVVVGGAGDKRMLAGLGVLVSSAIIVVIAVKVRAIGYSWGFHGIEKVQGCMDMLFWMVLPPHELRLCNAKPS